MPESGGCCRCCCSFIFTLGLTALFMWLSLRTSNPTCSIQYFYLPALNKSLNTPKNTTIYFQLRLDNPNKDKGIYYDDVNLYFFDSPTRNHSIGNATIHGFYQGHKKKATKPGNVTTQGVKVPVNGLVDFRVDLVTAVRFKIMAWKTKRHNIKVGGDIRVNEEGIKEYKKNIKLKSNAPKDTCYCVVVGVLVNFFVLVLLNF